MPNINYAENEFAIQRLINTTGAGEGSSLPPALRGSIRVPLVTNLKIVKRVTFSGGTQFTLTWQEPPEFLNLISHFNVYVTGLLSNNRQPLGPYTVRRSPAEVRVISDAETTVVFIVQTVLKNGQVSELVL